jgi:macrolide-specific efflux system membrane fusion protein
VKFLPVNTLPTKVAWRLRLSPLNLALLVLLLSLVGGGGWLLFGPSTPDTATTSSTVTVATTDVESTVSADGTVEPKDSADVDFDSDGTIRSVSVEVGDQVRVGTVLATASSSTAGVELNAAKVGLTAAEKNLHAAKENYDVVKETSSSLSDDEKEQKRSEAKSQIASAESSVASARSSVAKAQDTLGKLTLTAPVAGTVLAVNRTVGESTNGNNGTDSSDSNSDEPFATIANLDTWYVNCDFSEADVAKVHEGDDVDITFGSLPDETFTGSVKSIDLVATTSDGVTTYGVKVQITSAPEELRDGASATVTVTTASARDVLAVPTSAVTTDSQGQSTVKKVVNGTSTSQVVQIGIKGDLYTQITGGLKEGDKVELGATATSSSERGGFGAVRVGVGSGPSGGIRRSGGGG